VKSQKAWEKSTEPSPMILVQTPFRLVPVWRSGSAFLSYDFYVSVQRERSGVQPTAGASFLPNSERFPDIQRLLSVFSAFSERFFGVFLPAF
jgi:hypothetical protein